MQLAFTNFSIKSPTGKKSGRFFLALFLGIFLFLTHPCSVSWFCLQYAVYRRLLGIGRGISDSRQQRRGAVRLCDGRYIICIENFNDLTTEPDVVSAYYKNDTDADGNPVTQYSLAHQVRDADFAHANGMAYNPVTHEILVSGYSSRMLPITDVSSASTRIPWSRKSGSSSRRATIFSASIIFPLRAAI